MAKTFPPQLQFDDRHAFADTSNRFPADSLFRKQGYVIHARPNVGEVLWRDQRGHVFAQDAVLKRLTTVEYTP